MEGAEKAIAALKSLGPAGEEAFQNIAANSNKATTALERLDSGIQRTQKTGGNSKAIFQQLGYQVGDLAVQIQGGTSAITAFVQQGSQIAGAFGPVGAIIGAVGAVVGGLVGSFLSAGDAAKESSDALDKFIGGLGDAQSTIDSYAEALGKASDAQREFASELARKGTEDNSALAAKLSAQIAQVNRDQAVSGLTFSTTGDLSADYEASERLASALKSAREEAAALESSLNKAASAGDVQRVTELANQYKLLDGASRDAALGILELAKANQKNQAVEEQAAIKPPTFESVKLADSMSLRRQAEDRSVTEADKYAQDQVAEAVRKRAAEEEQVASKRKTAAAQAERAAERAVEAAKREAEQRARLIEGLDQQLAATKRLAAAAGDGAYATKLAQIETDNQKRILQATRELTGEQLEYAKKVSNEIAKLERQRASIDTSLPTGKSTDLNSLRRQAEREGFDSSGNPLPIDKNKATDEAKQFADQQYRILLQPWQDLASSVSGIMSDLYADILTGAKGLDFGSIASSFSDTINTAISGALGNLTALPINTAIQTIATQAMQNQSSGVGGALYDFYQNNPRLTGAAVGTVVGQVGGQALGLEQSKYSGLASGLGATGGAALGFMLGGPAGALIGGSLGGLAGNFAGSLFGGENNLGNDRSAQVYGSGAGKIIYGDSSFSQENRNITSGILGEVQTLQEVLQDLGASFEDFQIRVEAGNKSGITVDGVKYDNAQDALKASIEKLLSARTGGLTATQQTILDNTKGENAAEIGQDLAFGEQYDRLTFKGNDFDLALRDLQKSMEAARVQAHKLWLSVEEIDKSFAEGAAEIQRQRSQSVRGVYEQLAAAKGDNSLATQFFMLETQFRELAKAANDLGIPIEKVTEAHIAAAKRLRDSYREQLTATNQQLTQAGRNAYGAIDQFLDPIKQALGPFGIGQGVYSPQATAEGGLKEFREVLARAQGGDTQALSSIVGIGQQTLQAARSFGASGAEFQAIFKEVNKGLLETQNQLEERRMKLQEQGITYQRETLDEVLRLRVATVRELQELREQLRRDLKIIAERRAA